MTDEQLSVAHKYLDSYTRDVLKFSKPNMRFLKVGAREGGRACAPCVRVLLPAHPSSCQLL